MMSVNVRMCAEHRLFYDYGAERLANVSVMAVRVLIIDNNLTEHLQND